MQFIWFLFCCPAPWFLQGQHYTGLRIHPKRLMHLCCLLDRDGREMEGTSIFLSCHRGRVQWGQRAFMDVIMAEKGLLYVLWGPSDLSFISVKLYWLQQLFPDSHQLKGDQPLRYVAQTWDVSCIFMASQLAEKEALCWWSSTEMRTKLWGDQSCAQHLAQHGSFLPVISKAQLQTKFKLLDCTRRLSMYIYYSPANDIIIHWNDPLMIWFQYNGI